MHVYLIACFFYFLPLFLTLSVKSARRNLSWRGFWFLIENAEGAITLGGSGGMLPKKILQNYTKNSIFLLSRRSCRQMNRRNLIEMKTCVSSMGVWLPNQVWCRLKEESKKRNNFNFFSWVRHPHYGFSEIWSLRVWCPLSKSGDQVCLTERSHKCFFKPISVRHRRSAACIRFVF